MSIKLENLYDATLISGSYMKGMVKLNVTKAARELGVSRKTLSKRLNGFVPKTTRTRIKYLDDYYDEIKNLLEDELRIFEYIDHLYETMVDEHKISCNRSTFNRYIHDNKDLSKMFKKSKNKIFTERFETKPGQQAQFDLKERVKINYKTGEVIRVNIATLTMGFSRHNTRKIVLDTKYSTVISFLASAFEELGGSPKELVIDNIKCLVDIPRKRNGVNAILNSKFIEFLKDYNIKCLPCMPYRPKTKGKTETQNKKPSRLQNYNGQYQDLLDIHDKLKEINDKENDGISQATNLPRNFLLEKEKGNLNPLPRRSIQEKYYLTLNEVAVTNESLISYKSNKYSVPMGLISFKINRVVFNNYLHLYYNKKIVAIHKISNKKINILSEHDLSYESYNVKNEKNDDEKGSKGFENIISCEMENVIYDND